MLWCVQIVSVHVLYGLPLKGTGIHIANTAQKMLRYNICKLKSMHSSSALQQIPMAVTCMCANPSVC